MRKLFKHIIFLVVLGSLSLPMIQRFFNVFDEGQLNGDFVLGEFPEYSTDNWLNGTFQTGFDRYVEDHIGFRNFFVRLNNQLDFSLFDHINAEGLVKGKNNILYEYDYIRAYTGKDFIGEATITRTMNKLKFIQDHLKENFDIDVILIFEPSKARIQPEFIPENYLKDGITVSNYEFFKQKAEDFDINYLDLNAYLKQVSDTIRYPVYPPYGIHWSEHTMSFITDTLISFIETTRKIDMPEFSVETRFVQDSISDSDYDAGMTSNLLFKMDQQPLPYPFFTFYPDTTKTRPGVLAVADSYYWNIFNTRVPENLFENQAFWYFNAKVYPDFYFDEVWTEDLDLKTEVKKQDVILLGITERFLYKFGWRFVDQIYEIYGPKYSGNIVEKYEINIRNYSALFDQLQKTAEKTGQNLEQLILMNAHDEAIRKDFENYLTWHGDRFYKNVIIGDTSWRDSIIAKAARKNLSFEQQLKEEAMFLFKSNKAEVYQKFKLIQAYRDSIYSTPGWLDLIRQKAARFYLPVDEMVKVDAEYMADQFIKNDTPFKKLVRQYESAIRNTPEWLEAVREKAEKNGVSLDEMVRKDAAYVATEKMKEQEKKVE